MFAIYKKELRSYFINAIGYVYVGVFLAAAALLCCYTTIGSQSYDTSSYFTMLLFAFIVLIPLLIVLKHFGGEMGLMSAQPIADTLTLAMGIVMYIIIMNKVKKVSD